MFNTIYKQYDGEVKMKLEEMTKQMELTIEKELKEMPANLYKFDKKLNEKDEIEKLKDVIKQKEKELKLHTTIVRLEIDILEEKINKSQTI